MPSRLYPLINPTTNSFNLVLMWDLELVLL